MGRGLYQDLREPPQWWRPWREVYAAALERAEEAEQTGVDSVWCTEHHFFADGYLPQPLTWCAALAARTSWIAISTAILIAPLHHPLKIAEQAPVVVQDARNVAATSSRLRHDRRRWCAQGGAGRAELDGSPSAGSCRPW